MLGPSATLKDAHVERPALRGLSVVTDLHHFAIVSYLVDPELLRPLVHARFELETIDAGEGERALVSVVPFEDREFRFAAMPWPRFRFGQTNYRAYIIDRETGRRAVWFFGTVLDSWTVILPRHGWRLPWHRGRIRFDCTREDDRYRRYALHTESAWAGAEFEAIEDESPLQHPGFVDEETALVALTHPFDGFYFRRDGSLGSYRVWHEPLELRRGRCIRARFDLLDRLGLVPFARQAEPYSLLLQEETEFAVYLPPRRVD